LECVRRKPPSRCAEEADDEACGEGNNLSGRDRTRDDEMTYKWTEDEANQESGNRAEKKPDYGARSLCRYRHRGRSSARIRSPLDDRA